MTEKKSPEKTEKKSAPAKKPEAAKPAAAPKASAPKVEASAKLKQPAAKKAHSGATLKVVQTSSPIGRHESQRATLIGLGLNKLHRTRELPDTPDVRGMIEKVKHLVKVVG